MNGHLRIPVSEIAAYAGIHQFGPEKARDLLQFIAEMDDAFFAYVAEKRAEEEGKRPKKPKPQETPPPHRRR